MAGKRVKVVVAMSGGVDSSVAACLLVEQGYDVMGLFMRTGVSEPRDLTRAHIPSPGTPDTTETPRRLKPAAQQAVAREHQGCCSASDAADARFVAGMLAIPFFSLNFERDFDRLIDHFAAEYARGRTPNPCVVCNDRLKFGRLLDYADAVGARYIATGHYARIAIQGSAGSWKTARAAEGDRSGSLRGGADGRNVLLRGRDSKKDQSYVLFGLDRAILDRVLFPLGEFTKTEVRKIADRFNLPNRNKPDSVEICFVPDRDYARVVRERRPDAFVEGDVLDEAGEVIGRHKGIGQYTIGQRRGLGIAAGKPVYVTQLDVGKNTVTLGDGDALLHTSLIADRMNFLVDPPDGPFRAEVKIRYLHRAAPARVEFLPGGDGTEPRPSGSRQDSAAMNSKVRVVFDEPQRAITPGQAVVFYHDDLVLGGAWIQRVACTAIAG